MLTYPFKKDYKSVSMKVVNPKNFGLTEAEFENGLSRLRNDGDETLIQIIFETQYSDCCDLLINKYGASPDNAHEVVMDVLLKFREDLMLHKLNYNNLASIFKTKSWQNYVKTTCKSKHLVFIDPTLPDFDTAQDNDNIAQVIENQEVMNAFRKAFNQLCERCKSLMNRHYTEGLQWEQIGQMDNVKSGTIRFAASKCREKLKSYFQAAL
jgi:RNA polymerase sigma factor (sigma-70 family)